MTRIAQVKQYNYIVDHHGLNPAYKMTVGDGSMFDEPRQKGWVLFQSPKLGDARDFARWFPNRREAEAILKTEEEN
jgi:hypothetical protein